MLRKFPPKSLPPLPPPSSTGRRFSAGGSGDTTPTDSPIPTSALPMTPATPSTAADPCFPRLAMERFLCPGTAPPDAAPDKYTAGIEVSNACRGWYVWRAARRMDTASRLDRPAPPSSGNKRLDAAFSSLKESMVSLLDQDLGLMRQLLTLNERIEELKWQHKLRPRAARGAAGTGSASCTCCPTAACTCYRESYYSLDTLGTSERLDSQEAGMSGSREMWHAKYASPSSLSLVEECDVSFDDLDDGDAGEEGLPWRQETGPRGRLSAVSWAPPHRACTLPRGVGGGVVSPPPATNPGACPGGSLGRPQPAAAPLGTEDLSNSGKHSLDSGFQETDTNHDPNVEMVI